MGTSVSLRKVKDMGTSVSLCNAEKDLGTPVSLLPEENAEFENEQEEGEENKDEMFNKAEVVAKVWTEWRKFRSAANEEKED